MTTAVDAGKRLRITLYGAGIWGRVGWVSDQGQPRERQIEVRSLDECRRLVAARGSVDLLDHSGAGVTEHGSNGTGLHTGVSQQRGVGTA
jgi:hypothetical protein